MSKHFITKVSEQHPEHEQKEIELDIHSYGGQVWIEVKDANYTEQGMLVEYWEDELRAVVWSNPEQEDPTHTIKIEPMSPEFRKEYEKCLSE